MGLEASACRPAGGGGIQIPLAAFVWRPHVFLPGFAGKRSAGGRVAVLRSFPVLFPAAGGGCGAGSVSAGFVLLAEEQDGKVPHHWQPGECCFAGFFRRAGNCGHDWRHQSAPGEGGNGCREPPAGGGGRIDGRRAGGSACGRHYKGGAHSEDCGAHERPESGHRRDCRRFRGRDGARAWRRFEAACGFEGQIRGVRRAGQS